MKSFFSGAQSSSNSHSATNPTDLDDNDIDNDSNVSGSDFNSGHEGVSTPEGSLSRRNSNLLSSDFSDDSWSVVLSGGEYENETGNETASNTTNNYTDIISGDEFDGINNESTLVPKTTLTDISLLSQLQNKGTRKGRGNSVSTLRATSTSLENSANFSVPRININSFDSSATIPTTATTKSIAVDLIKDTLSTESKLDQLNSYLFNKKSSISSYFNEKKSFIVQQSREFDYTKYRDMGCAKLEDFEFGKLKSKEFIGVFMIFVSMILSGVYTYSNNGSVSKGLSQPRTEIHFETKTIFSVATETKLLTKTETKTAIKTQVLTKTLTPKNSNSKPTIYYQTVIIHDSVTGSILQQLESIGSSVADTWDRSIDYLGNYDFRESIDELGSLTNTGVGKLKEFSKKRYEDSLEGFSIAKDYSFKTKELMRDNLETKLRPFIKARYMESQRQSEKLARLISELYSNDVKPFTLSIWKYSKDQGNHVVSDKLIPQLNGFKDSSYRYLNGKSKQWESYKKNEETLMGLFGIPRQSQDDIMKGYEKVSSTMQGCLDKSKQVSDSVLKTLKPKGESFLEGLDSVIDQWKAEFKQIIKDQELRIAAEEKAKLMKKKDMEQKKKAMEQQKKKKEGGKTWSW